MSNIHTNHDREILFLHSVIQFNVKYTPLQTSRIYVSSKKKKKKFCESFRRELNAIRSIRRNRILFDFNEIKKKKKNTYQFQQNQFEEEMCRRTDGLVIDYQVDLSLVQRNNTYHRNIERRSKHNNNNIKTHYVLRAQLKRRVFFSFTDNV